MLKETTIHGQNANDLFEKYKTNSKGQVRRVIGKRAGKWMVPDEKLKRKILNNGIY